MRDLWWIVFLFCQSIFVLLLITPGAHAAERIQQGQTVYLGDVVDVSGVSGWDSAYGNRIAWYNGYMPYSTITPYIITLPPKARASKPSQYEYFIDPAIYGNKTGEWHQYYPMSNDDTETPERHGNTLAFIVQHERVYTLNQTDNGTFTWNQTNQTSPKIPIESPVVAQKKVSDYLVTRGDSITIPTYGYANVWLFGRIDGRYDIPSVNNTVTFSVADIQSMEPGAYALLVQKMGTNSSVFTVRYNSEKQTLESFNPVTFLIDSMELYGISSQERLNRVVEVFKASVDTYTTYKFEIQEPGIEITQIDTLYSTDTITLLDVRGYTNVATGARLRFILDEDKQTPRTIEDNTYYTDAQGNNPGDMRYFKILIPLMLDQLPSGEHYITAYTALGGYQKVPYFVWEIPGDSYIPNKTMKYVGGNEFIPTPTPLIVEKIVIPTPIRIIETVTVPVPPSQESVNEAQWDVAQKILTYVTACIVTVAMVAYIVSAWARRKV